MNLSYPLVSRNKTLVRRCGLVTMIAIGGCQQSTGTPAAPTPATVSLSGVVVSQDGSPVPGASTSVRGLDGMNRFTEADGRFTLVEPRTSAGSGQLQVVRRRNSRLRFSNALVVRNDFHIAFGKR
jgi:hypothetical protein